MPLATAGDDQTGTSAPKRHRSVPDESSACAKCASELPAKTTCSLTAGDVMTHDTLWSTRQRNFPSSAPSAYRKPSRAPTYTTPSATAGEDWMLRRSKPYDPERSPTPSVS